MAWRACVRACVRLCDCTLAFFSFAQTQLGGFGQHNLKEQDKQKHRFVFLNRSNDSSETHSFGENPSEREQSLDAFGLDDQKMA